MKALLILLAIAAGVWWYQRSRRVSAAAAEARPKPANDPQPMLRCACCGVHLPVSSALAGRAGRVYCCPAHQQDMENR
jgi:uncharacterized protein